MLPHLLGNHRKNYVIGAGSVITRDLKENYVCYNNPFKEQRLI